jgi:hypothetical protein
MLSGISRYIDRALADYLHESLGTEGIAGQQRPNRWMPGDTTSEVIRRLSGVDVHIHRVESVHPERRGTLIDTFTRTLSDTP